MASGHPRGLVLLIALIALPLIGACSLWPRQDPLSRGQRLFTNLCSSSACHGAGGDQVNGVSLLSERFMESRTDDTLFKAISNGNRAMLPFSQANGGALSDGDTRDLIAYLRATAGAAADLQPVAGSIANASSAGSSPAGGPASTSLSTSSPSDSRPKKGLAPNATYVRYCLVCHKEDGFGVPSAPIGYRGFVSRLGQELLAKAISQGEKTMPAWGSSKGGPISEPEIAGLAAFILSASSDIPPPSPTPGPATPTPEPPMAVGTMESGGSSNSDPVGKALYDQFCAVCHPQPGVLSTNTNRANALKYVPGITDAQVDMVIDYLMGKGAATTLPAALGSGGATRPQPSGRSSDGPPPAIPHNIQGKVDKCLQCHARGAMAPFPIGHTGRDVEWCTMCHEPAPKPAPRMTHGIDDRAGKCMLCHDVDGGATRVPRDHGSRGLDTCLFCHPAP